MHGDGSLSKNEPWQAVVVEDPCDFDKTAEEISVYCHVCCLVLETYVEPAFALNLSKLRWIVVKIRQEVALEISHTKVDSQV